MEAFAPGNFRAQDLQLREQVAIPVLIFLIKIQLHSISKHTVPLRDCHLFVDCFDETGTIYIDSSIKLYNRLANELKRTILDSARGVFGPVIVPAPGTHFAPWKSGIDIVYIKKVFRWLDEMLAVVTAT